jgi:hypothetical protein
MRDRPRRSLRLFDLPAARRLTRACNQGLRTQSWSPSWRACPFRLEDMRVVTPTHLDILWGASFASGEERYVRLIIDRLAATANRSELIAIDVTRTALAMWGGPQEIVGQLKGKYGEKEAYDIIVAATAAWALGSNARRHEFVEKAMKTYKAEHAGSHVAKVLLVLNSRK